MRLKTLQDGSSRSTEASEGFAGSSDDGVVGFDEESAGSEASYTPANTITSHAGSRCLADIEWQHLLAIMSRGPRQTKHWTLAWRGIARCSLRGHARCERSKSDICMRQR